MAQTPELIVDERRCIYSGEDYSAIKKWMVGEWQTLEIFDNASEIWRETHTSETPVRRGRWRNSQYWGVFLTGTTQLKPFLITQHKHFMEYMHCDAASTLSRSSNGLAHSANVTWRLQQHGSCDIRRTVIEEKGAWINDLGYVMPRALAEVIIYTCRLLSWG